MQLVQQKAQTTQQMAQIVQMGGTQQDMANLQQVWQLHEQAYGYLEQLAQNPGFLLTPDGANNFTMTMNEYLYRTDYQDFRPTAQIQPQLQQYHAQAVWKSTTPEGQAAHQAQLQQNQMLFDQNQAQVRANSAQRDREHQQFVNGIHDRHQYVNPYDGQNHMLPNTYSTSPYIQNPDGSYTQLVPYHQY